MTFDLWLGHLQCIGCAIWSNSARIWAKSSNPRRNYCDFNIWPNDLEHLSRVALRSEIICTKSELGQPIRSWLIPFLTADKLCHAVTLTFDPLTRIVHSSLSAVVDWCPWLRQRWVYIGNSHKSHGFHGNPKGMGIAKLISWEWEWLNGNVREWKLQSVVLRRLLLELRRTVTHSTVIAHQLRSTVSLTLMISSTQKTINSKAAMNWQNMSTRMGMGAGGNGNNQWE